jgi:hypothetical protein
MAYDTIAALAEVFQQLGREERRLVNAELGEPAKYLMFRYTNSKAVEGRRTRSAQTLLDGLIPVIMAGGKASTATAGLLLSILLRSALIAGVDAQELFSRGASLAWDETVAEGIRGFPLLPPELRDIARFGVQERKTKGGVIYEHVVDALFRPRWWDRLLRRRRPQREGVVKILEDIENERSLGQP